MPEILLMRHAKSTRDAGVARDRDRPLAPRGEAAARVMGTVLSRIGATPELVMTSPAVRARATAALAAAAGGWDARIEVVDDLYGRGTEAVLDTIAAAPSVGRMLLVGHEPTWSSVVGALIGGGRHRMVTAAVACVELTDPSRPSGGHLLWMLIPRSFTDLGLTVT